MINKDSKKRVARKVLAATSYLLLATVLVAGCVFVDPAHEEILNEDALAEVREEISQYQNMVFVHSGDIVACNSDGTVSACGLIVNMKEEITSWTDIVAIATGASNGVAAGLRADGTVMFTAALDSREPIKDGKLNYFDESINGIGSWHNVVAIDANDTYVVALTSEGRVLFAGVVPGYELSYLNSLGFNNCVAIITGGTSILVLDENGHLDACTSLAQYWISISDFPPLW